MKVFISWSGERSRHVANLLHEWISCVLQAVKPWVSTRDIDRGALWFGQISGQLQEASVGIICLTHENKDQPWILFEAGALAKGLSSSRVCTLLVDLEPADIKDPLAQFNHTRPAKSDMFALVSTLNAALGEQALEERVLVQVFETYFPQFEARFKQVIDQTELPAPSGPREKEDVLSEVLDSVRAMSNRLARLERQELVQSQPPLARAGGGVGGSIPAIQDAARALHVSGGSFKQIATVLSAVNDPKLVEVALRALPEFKHEFSD